MTDKAIEKDQKTKNIVGGGNSQRIGYIDALKGFAIICVVVGHIVGGYYDANTFPQSANLLYTVHNIIYIFHMPLFMAISGFVYCAAYFDTNGYPKKSRIYNQILNMICVYILFSLIYGAVKLLFSRFVTNDISIIDIILIPIKPISLYWYIYVLVFLYLIFSFNFVYTVNYRIVLFVTVSVSFIGQCISISLFDISRLMYYSFFFYIGIAYRRYKTESYKYSKVIICGMFLISCVLTAVFWNTAKESDKYIDSIPIVKMIVAIGTAATIWFLFENIKLLAECKFLKYLGKRSLEIYVIHGFLISGLRPILNMLGVTNVYASIIINLILSILLPILFAEICRCLKIHDLIFKPISWIKMKRVN